MKMKKLLSMLLAMAVTTTSVSVWTAEPVFAEETTCPVSNEAPIEKNYVYGIMKIPYADFYKAELGETNNVTVDAVTSATANKWKTQKGTYSEIAAEGNGGTILGVEYYVAVEHDIYEKLKNTESTLLNTFKEIEEIPATYKVMDEEGNFLAVQGTVMKLNDVTASLTTKSNYGDYQLNMTGLALTGIVYGAVVKTTNGTRYALRHLENIWKNGAQLSWSTGFSTTESHGNKLSYEHYSSMMGKTIESVEFICDNGIYTVDDIDAYVPIKYDGTFQIADTDLTAKQTAVTMTGFPEDGNWQLDLPEGLKNASYENGKIFYDAGTLPGLYTITAKDTNHKYADNSASFIVKANTLPVQFKDGKITALDNTSAEETANYIKNLAMVTVKFGEKTTSYSASGHGAVAIIAEDGSVDLQAGSRGTSVFAEEGTYELTLASNGYPELIFSVEKQEAVTESPTPTSIPVPTKTATAVLTKTVTPTPKVTAPKKVTISKVSNVKGKKLKVAWKKDKTVAGYQIQIATNKKFTSGKKTYTVKKAATTSKTITGLKKKKTYYIRVRAYKTSDSKKIYGNYSSVKKVTIKK